MRPRNERLEYLIGDWRAKGSPEQEAFSWLQSKLNWQALANEFKVDISDFPDEINRKFLWQMSSSSVPVDTLFLGVMIWGYGNIGYGPHRVRQMYRSDQFQQTLQEVKSLCNSKETLAAYSALKKSRIKQLGPSFGSKVLTFFHAEESAPAILDSIVAQWLNKEVPYLQGASLVNAETWNLGTYENYIKWINEMSKIYGVPGCTVEQLIFSDGYGLG
jgi:hypothetical protein